MSEVMKPTIAGAALLSLALSPLSARAQTEVQPALSAAANPCADRTFPPGFTPAAVKSRAAPVFPEVDAADESEGWVRLGFTIDAEGETKDIVVLDHVGSRSMLKAARLAVARWTYKPATENGQAVEQYGSAAEILYRAQNVGNAAVHDAVVARFDEGRALVAAGKYAEGIAVLEQSFALPLTLYEQAKVSFALAFAYEKSNNMPRALEHARHALIEDGHFLEKSVVPAAQRLRLRVEAANGNVHHAACAPRLPESDPFDPSGVDRAATMKIVDAAKRRLASSDPLTVAATLTPRPAGAEGGVWEHPLSRRKFKFSGATGQVQEFRLTCVTQVARGPVNETAEWGVPAAAGPCTLRVFGSVDATVKLIEEW